MKKFFTLIAFTSALVPAIHGMEADLFADARKKYDHLIQLIKKADVEAFKRAFDDAQLPSSNSLRVNAAKMETIKGVLVLEQVVFETKEEITKELEALGDNNKNWSKIAKGGLVTLGGVSSLASIYVAVNSFTIHGFQLDRVPLAIRRIASLNTLISMLPSMVLLYAYSFISGSMDAYDKQQNAIDLLSLTSAIVGSIIACKALPYGIKTLKAGLNYKQHLQDQLTNLDAIAAHIAHGTQVAHA